MEKKIKTKQKMEAEKRKLTKKKREIIPERINNKYNESLKLSGKCMMGRVYLSQFNFINEDNINS